MSVPSDEPAGDLGEGGARRGARGLGHVPVLPKAVVELLRPRAGEVYVDCTAGLGGHAALMVRWLVGEESASDPGRPGTIILNDSDPANLPLAEAAVERARGGPGHGLGRGSNLRVVSIRGNFAELPGAMVRAGHPPGDMLLADLGFASPQVDDPARGFSFMRDGPLDMRLDPTLRLSARELVNEAPEAELARILREFGEEPGARAIARKLVQERRERPISTTAELAEIVRGVVPRKPGGIDPATKTFQALRIAVNDEIGSLEALLGAISEEAERIGVASNGTSPTAAGTGGAGGSWLRPGARVGIISFHSLEDRPVKRAFEELVRRGLASDVSSGARQAEAEEIEHNPRARSAKLRVIRLEAEKPSKPESKKPVK